MKKIPENTRILLVEDEKNLVRIILDTLVQEGFEIEVAYNGNEGLLKFHEIRPHIIVTDIMMPRMDGFEMVKRIRETDRNTPILFLSARSETDDVVTGFELGCNDYLKKPFGIAELIVRIKALVNKPRVERQCKNFYTLGQYMFNPIAQTLSYQGVLSDLSHRESEILRHLCENREQVVHTQSILLELWGDDSFFNTRSLHVFITKLRHKLAKDKNIRIVNVRGIGYKLIG
ncbi:response regulator transcription factor [Barnesiella propionica]|uniref:response regulator transcription factor n=1 Tax=Barnesiella propionica TaxID=2981781 RepID=UPI0011C77513|nr:response regulator transcription factor [Barnesiella propionica]MCU6769517.1 response regulator transcription factor [Barnesiella propionica]